MSEAVEIDPVALSARQAELEQRRGEWAAHRQAMASRSLVDLSTRLPEQDSPSAVSDWDEAAPLSTELPDLDDPPNRTAAPLWDMATAAATELQVRRELVLLPMLGAISVAASGAWEARIGRNWTEAGILWTLAVAPPGSRKSGSLDVAVDPLHAWEKRQREAESTDLAANNSMHRKILRQLEQAEKADETSIEDLQRLHLDLEQTPERWACRLTTGDSTPEATATLMRKQGGRLGIVSDEAGPLTTIAGRYSGGAGSPVSTFNQGYDAKRMTVDRQSSSEIVVDRAALTIALAVQPGVLRSIAQKAPDLSTSGFMQRFLFTHVRPLGGVESIDPPEVPAETAQAWEATLERLVGFSRNQEKPITAGLTTKARQAFDEWRREFNTRRAPGGDLVGDETMTEWLSKMPGKVVRLALLLWVADWAAENKLHVIKDYAMRGEPVVIDVKPMRDAISLADALISHARAVLGQMQGRATETPTLTAEVWREIERLSDAELEPSQDDPSAMAFRTRRLTQKLKRRAWLRDGGTKVLKQELLRLVELGHLRSGRVPGSTAEAWVINPFSLGAEVPTGDHDET